MRRVLLALLVIFPGFSVQAAAPIAEVICDNREAMELKLQQSYGAVRRGHGIRGPDTIMELWSVPATGAWTMIQRYANGQSCIVAMGEAWEALQDPIDPA